MAKLLVFGNFEIALDAPEGSASADDLIREKERELLAFLRRLTGREGSVEALELESFTYEHLGGEARGYYYSKYEPEPEAELR